MTLTEERVSPQLYMDSPVKVWRPTANSIEYSRATVEKEREGQMNNMGVCLAPSPILKAKGSKCVSQSSSCHRPGGRDVKIYNKKMDYSKVKPVVNWGAMWHVDSFLGNEKTAAPRQRPVTRN
jgi:hypothetical protein